MVGAWWFGWCQAHQGLPVGFLLLLYSVLFTVESLSLLYLLFVSSFICSRRWCIVKLGVFHAKKTFIVSWSTSELRVRLALWNRFKPPSKIFYWRFQGGASFVDHHVSVLSWLGFRACLFIDALWSSARKGMASWLSFVMNSCGFVTFPLVSLVRCGIWLYRFLIFAVFF